MFFNTLITAPIINGFQKVWKACIEKIPKLNWQIFPGYLRNIVGSWGVRTLSSKNML